MLLHLSILSLLTGPIYAKPHIHSLSSLIFISLIQGEKKKEKEMTPENVEKEWKGESDQ